MTARRSGRKRRREVVGTLGGGKRVLGEEEVKQFLGENGVEEGGVARVKFKVKEGAAQVEEGRFKYVDKERESYVISYEGYSFDCFLPPQDTDVSLLEVKILLGSEETDSSQDVPTDEEDIEAVAKWRADVVLHKEAATQTVGSEGEGDDDDDGDGDGDESTTLPTSPPPTLATLQRTQLEVLRLLRQVIDREKKDPE